MEWIVGTRPLLLLPYQSVESYSSPFECELALATRLQQKCCVSLLRLGQKKPCSFFLIVLVSWNTCYLGLPFRMLPFGSCQTVRSLGHVRGHMQALSWHTQLGPASKSSQPRSQTCEWSSVCAKKKAKRYLVMSIIVRVMHCGRDTNAHQIVHVFVQIS